MSSSFKAPTLSALPAAGIFFQCLLPKKFPPKKSKYAIVKRTSRTINQPIIINPLSIITSFLFQINPYKNSTNEIIQSNLRLRLINKEYAEWLLKIIFVRLSFREFQNVRKLSFQHVRKLLSLTSGNHVRVLDFTGCTKLTDAIALVGIERSPLIRDLKLTQCPVLSDAIFRIAVSALRRLEVLSVGRSTKLSGRGLLNCLRSKRFPASRIRELRLPSMKYVDDILMNDICQTIGSSLEILDVNNTNLSDSFLISIRNYNSNLKRLLAGNNHFTNGGLVSLVDSHNIRNPLLHLIEIDVSYSSGVSDSGVLSICSGYSKTLEILAIAGLENRLSVRGLHTITQILPKLKSMDLRFCSNIRPKNIKNLIYITKENVEIMR
jgi:hypothetical protein